MINLINKLKNLVNKLSPTATDLHIPVPISRDDKINKVIADYNKINDKLKQLKINNTSINRETDEYLEVDDTVQTQDSQDVYRGKAF